MCADSNIVWNHRSILKMCVYLLISQLFHRKTEKNFRSRISLKNNNLKLTDKAPQWASTLNKNMIALELTTLLNCRYVRVTNRNFDATRLPATLLLFFSCLFFTSEITCCIVNIFILGFFCETRSHQTTANSYKHFIATSHTVIPFENDLTEQLWFPENWIP